jgi:NDP-sugar pyrophosphorylase family protein
MRATQALLLLASPNHDVYDDQTHCHRALVPIAGRMILGLTIDSLASVGVQQISRRQVIGPTGAPG